jgi:PKD repeat protein
MLASMSEESLMPDPSEGAKTAGKAQEGAPVDGVTQTPAATASVPPPDPATMADLMKKRRIIKLILLIAAAFFTFYVIFGLVLMSLIPAPDGGRQGLKMMGIAFYGLTAAAVTVVGGFLGLRMYQATRGQLLPLHVRLYIIAGALIIALDAFAGGTIFLISRPPALSLDIISPTQTRSLVAPVAVTFGTERLRSTLAKQGIPPVSYRWDFEGDGTIDVEKRESEVTTVYKKKGIYTPTVHVVLSNGSVRRSSLTLIIPHAVFSYRPEVVTPRQPVTFSVAELIQSDELQEVKWDFNGDGIVDEVTNLPEIEWTYENIATFQARATVLLKNGTQETLERSVEVTGIPPGDFSVTIEVEGGSGGTIPHGVILSATAEEGIDVAEYTWTLPDKQKLLGQRVSYTFEKEGTYEILLTVVARNGQSSRSSVRITAWLPLELPDFSLNAVPDLQRDGKISGPTPLEVKLEPSTKQPFITFTWEQEGATQIIRQDKTYHAFYDREGSFPLVLIAKDEKGRTQKMTYTVEALPAPSRVVLKIAPPTGPAPLSVHFDASESVVPGKRITGFSWIFGDEEVGERAEPQYLGSQVDHRYEKPGNYSVTVRVLTEDGEEFELKKNVIVRAAMLDACIFPSRTSGSAPLGVKFYPSCSTGNIASYLWDFGDGTQSEDMEPSHVFEQRGAFTVKLSIFDGKGGESETSIDITVE